jgi:amidase
MEYHLGDSKCIFAFSAYNQPALTVPAGATVTIETQDCFANQLQTLEDTLETMDWNQINPATGPIFVEGAAPGNVLKVTVVEIAVGQQGVMATGKDMGALGGRFDKLYSKLIPIRNGQAVFGPQIQMPLKPMIGVIGVAPADGEPNTGTPGCHGGNMDNKMVAAGAVLYLPVFVGGALFALGDVHAVMGDGEIGVTGVETPARIEVRLDVLQNLHLTNPVLENESFLTTVASALDLDEAVYQATSDMADLLSARLSLPLPDLVMLLSAVGEAQICQVVDPLRTARFVMPKWVLENYGFSL